MNLVDYVSNEHIIELEGNISKNDILKQLTDELKNKGLISDADKTLSALVDREKLGSTAVGDEIAIPHAKLQEIDDVIILLAISRDGVDFDSVDKLPVKVIFLVLASDKKMNLHLKTLARISRLIKMTDFKKRVNSTSSSEEILSVLSEEESRL